MRCGSLIWCLALTVLAGQSGGQESNPALGITQHVYLVKATLCSSHPAPTQLTGFTIGAEKEILTALHGVADCSQLSASQSGEKGFDVELYSVDIPRDIAVLRPKDDQEWRGPTGFSLADAPPAENDTLVVAGYPLGLTYPLISHLMVRTQEKRNAQQNTPRQRPASASPTLQRVDSCPTPGQSRLDNLADESLKRALKIRGSPAPTICMLDLEGHVRAGESGAPILNNRNEVVGIAIGSLHRGPPAISWATPLDRRSTTLRLQPAKTNDGKDTKEVERLKGLNPSDVALGDVRFGDLEVTGFVGTGTGLSTPSLVGGASLTYALGRRRWLLPYIEAARFTGVNEETLAAAQSTQQIISRTRFTLSFLEAQAGLQFAASHEHTGLAPFVRVGAGKIWTHVADRVTEELSRGWRSASNR